MGFGPRKTLGKLGRKALSPFKKIGAKLKKEGQRFVIKTMERHEASKPIPPTPQAGVPNDLLIPLLRARRRTDRFQSTPIQAVPVDQYLLTSHPRADFFYHQPTDLADTPWIVMGDFQPNVTAWICSSVPPDGRVLVIGGGQGYHLLSIANELTAGGKLLWLSPQGDERAVRELNLRSHRFEDRVELQALTPEELCGEALPAALESFDPTMIVLDLPDSAEMHSAVLAKLQDRHVCSIDEDRVVEIGPRAGNSNPLATPSRKVA